MIFFFTLGGSFQIENTSGLKMIKRLVPFFSNKPNHARNENIYFMNRKSLSTSKHPHYLLKTTKISQHSNVSSTKSSLSPQKSQKLP